MCVSVYLCYSLTNSVEILNGNRLQKNPWFPRDLWKVKQVVAREKLVCQEHQGNLKFCRKWCILIVLSTIFISTTKWQRKKFTFNNNNKYIFYDARKLKRLGRNKVARCNNILITYMYFFLYFYFLLVTFRQRCTSTRLFAVASSLREILIDI